MIKAGYPIKEWVDNVCQLGQGAMTCRYLTVSPKGWSCEKHSSLRRMLDARVLAKTMLARGDNCRGKDSRFEDGQIKNPIALRIPGSDGP